MITIPNHKVVVQINLLSLSLSLLKLLNRLNWVIVSDWLTNSQTSTLIWIKHLSLYSTRRSLVCPVNALRAQNLVSGHFLGHKIRLVFVSLSI